MNPHYAVLFYALILGLYIQTRVCQGGGCPRPEPNGACGPRMGTPSINPVVTAQLIGTGLDTRIVKHVGAVPSSGRNFKH